MDISPNLGLPYLAASQAQKHVTHNEALRMLDALVQIVVEDTSHSSPPASPEEGAAYIVSSPATEAFVGHENALAVFQDGAWAFFQPVEGWCAWDAAEATLIVYTQNSWQSLVARDEDEAAQFGINTSADSTNRLSVKSDAILFSHDDVTPGTGSARTILNKAGGTNTASLLFQTGYSGRAEIGLMGDNSFRCKVSSDGTAFADALAIDPETAQVSFPAGLTHPASGAPMNSFIPVSGGFGEISIYRIDTPRSQNPRLFTIDEVTDDRISLSTASVPEIFNNAAMEGVSLLRIWNITKSPAEPAWVVRGHESFQLDVRDAAAVAGWLPGEMLQVGDPESVTPGRCIAIDISPMLQAKLGAVFAQKAIVTRIVLGGISGGHTGVGLTGDGSSGSFISARTYEGGNISYTQFIIPTVIPSPVSPSHIVLIREEDHGGQCGIVSIGITGLFA